MSVKETQRGGWIRVKRAPVPLGSVQNGEYAVLTRVETIQPGGRYRGVAMPAVDGRHKEVGRSGIETSSRM